MNINFENVASREPLEPGKYQLRIAECSEAVSSTGNPMIKLVYDVIANDEGEAIPGGRKLWDNMSLQEQALFRLKDLLDACGYDTSGSLDFEPEDLIGCEILAQVVQEEYNGNTKNRVKRIIKL